MTLIAIVGATGTGKSDFALDLAEALARAAGRRGRQRRCHAALPRHGHRHRQAPDRRAPGRAAPPPRRARRHRGGSRAAYQPAARAAIDDILARDGVALLVGGSGLYVSSVIHDFRFPGTDRGPRQARAGAGRARPRAPARPTARDRPRDGGERRRPERPTDRACARGDRGHGEPKAARLPDEPLPWRPHRIVHCAAIGRDSCSDSTRAPPSMWRDGILDEVADSCRSARTRGDRAQGDRVRPGARRAAGRSRRPRRSPRRSSSRAPTPGAR